MINPEDVKAIRELHVGGFRLHPWEGSAHDYCKPGDAENALPPKKKYLGSPYLTPNQVAEKLNEMQDMAMARQPGIPLHYSIDQEGDISADHTRGGVLFFPSAMAYSAAGDVDLCRRCNRIVAQQLRAIGIHFIHSPVLDVNVNPDNPEIYTRSYSDDPAVVIEYAQAALEAFEAEGVCGVGKHFPGRGQSDVDAHFEIPRYNCTREEMEEIDLAPYRALVNKGLKAIMTAHTIYPAMGDSENVATLSKIILTDFLRGELGFKGMITTDSMTMAGIVAKFGVAPACAMALAAGVDLVLMKSHQKDQIACIETALEWAKDGRLPMERLDSAVRCVLSFKRDMGLFETPKVDASKAEDALHKPANIELVREVCERSAMVLKNDGILPLKPEQKILVLEQHSFFCFKANDLYYHEGQLAEAIWNYAPETDGVRTGWRMSELSMETLQPKLDWADVVVCTNNYGRFGGMNDELVQALLATGKPMVVITNSPYQAKRMKHAPALVLNYLSVTHGLQVTADILFGKCEPTGSWPLKRFAWED